MQSINTNKANEYTSTCRAMSDCTHTLKCTHMLDCIHIYMSSINFPLSVLVVVLSTCLLMLTNVKLLL